MMKRSASRFAVFGLVLWSFAHHVSAQVISYKRNSLEVKGGVGGTFFFGDLGGSHGEGKAGFFDFDVQSMRGNSSVGLKFNITNLWSVRTDFAYAQIMGDDQYSGDQGRFNRNLSFRSDVYEVSITSELVGINFSRFSRTKTATSELYGFVGVGVIQFNPQAFYQGRWYSLQPLGTEGQGLEGESEPYSLTSVVVPYGVGYRKNVGEKTYIGIELSMRKSFTDYLDDVSGKYPNRARLAEERGEVAAALSDRS